ncbi:putative translation initiation factor IF2/IF5, ubiquitin interacting, MINDY deubiquitinase [Rosa chinensis]|uniref:Eukaryotic translation initiation factor 2 subunit beta n=1 Tax=Rosa chinensis TaxID=74649 RepID=A0A2P6SNR3_ROSCH|nr:ubiquitin carboxyl-terminal hydrolase MINDY-1 [Rosa chinensis]PRQ60320.1 putative translation initiation factor IF2/IF5, ubiquitin interacting, MINDY deubiquitinase [Rosa chinensis]
MASSSEEPPQQPQSVKDCLYKTKLIQFLDRTAPIVLQNDNGPCPLLAICNVLSLRNNLNLSADTTEVSQEKLLTLVAERLIDSIDNKDAVADAIDLLPRLATGINVDIKFTRISDFESTPERAIFDLLDIPLYHGWIVDPVLNETANAIESKSYNTLMGELVAMETQSMTATLGVPSPSLSKTRYLVESPHSASSDEPKVIKAGDREEEAELLMALQMSMGELSTSVGDPECSNSHQSELSVQQGELIRTFLKNNASQLTYYGLFCLQDGLKEQELCVFFRNNHFSTMFKINGEVYLLATDQGYLNQHDLVWEKLNEVNGDTLFMTGNFKEFKVDNQSHENWTTADYLASIDSAASAGFDINSDLQLAIALQQQDNCSGNSTKLDDGEKSGLVLTPPQVLEGSKKKTVLVNFMEYCRAMVREPDHVMSFMLAELDTSGSLDEQLRLVVKGRFLPKKFGAILRKYVNQYVICFACRRTDTRLSKENRPKYHLICEWCCASRSVAPIKAGFVAKVGNRNSAA